MTRDEWIANLRFKILVEDITLTVISGKTANWLAMDLNGAVWVFYYKPYCEKANHKDWRMSAIQCHKYAGNISTGDVGFWKIPQLCFDRDHFYNEWETYIVKIKELLNE